MPPNDDEKTLLPEDDPRKNRAMDVTSDSTAQENVHPTPESTGFGVDSRSWGGTAFDGASAPKIGQSGARYKTLSKLGEGGFGIVYLADQTEPVRRKVALKVMKMAFASPSTLARFEAEKQALAIMDHPGLAKVFDAGTTPEGQPYFVMEYAPGEPLAAFCDHRRIDIRGRITLLAQICDAIQHAHMKGVVHRDLKPGNILVCETDEGFRAKVIDFGIAKAISAGVVDNVLETQFGQFVGTPVYMSPEQAEGGLVDIDTRSDIYSIGVILYELLASTTPIDSETLRRSGIAHMHRTIMETEPPRPSARLAKSSIEERKSITNARSIEFGALEKLLKRDLDWITMRCLEKDRTHRYESASGLAADLRRYLDGEAVLAGPPGTRYRMEKFVRRNRVAVAAGCIAVVGLITFAVVMGFLWSKAEKQQLRAEQTLAVFLTSLKSSNVMGSQADSSVTVLDFLKVVEKEATEKPQTQQDIANDVREMIGPAFISLADYESAARTMLASVQYRRDAALNGDVTENIALGNCLHEYARSLYHLERFSESKVVYEEALAIRMKYLPPKAPDIATTNFHLSSVYLKLNEIALFEQKSDNAIEIFRGITENQQERLITALFSRARDLQTLSRNEDSEKFANECAQIITKNFGKDDWRLGRVLTLLADIENARDRPELSLIQQQRALELITPRFGPNHPTVTQAQQKLAETLCILATGTSNPIDTTQIKDAAKLDEAIENAQFAVDGRRHEVNSPETLVFSLALLSKLNELKGDIETSINLESRIIALLRERAPQAAEEIANAQIRLAELQAIQAAHKIPAPAPAPASASAPAKTP